MYFVSQCIHALSHPYISYMYVHVDFFLETFYGDMFLLFLIARLMQDIVGRAFASCVYM